MEKQYSPFTRTQLITINGKKVRLSRYLMEQQLGRKLLPNEQVHHLNKNPLDNRLENLAVMDVKQHMRLHKQKHPLIKVCEICGNEYEPSPRKRKRQKCCSIECCNKLRTINMAKTRGYPGW